MNWFLGKLYNLISHIIRACSKLLNFVTLGPRGWTFSARSHWETTHGNPIKRLLWTIIRMVIDMVFWLLRDGMKHTLKAWLFYRKK